MIYFLCQFNLILDISEIKIVVCLLKCGVGVLKSAAG